MASAPAFLRAVDEALTSPAAVDPAALLRLLQTARRDAAAAAMEIDPSPAVEAMERQVIGFAMPGEGIPSFNAHARVIAAAGIYNLAVHHEQILEPIVVKFWNLPGLEGLTPEAEQARERVMKYIEKSARVAARLKERHEARDAASANGDHEAMSA